MRRGTVAKISLMNETATCRYALFPATTLHRYLRVAATAIKKPDIEKKGTPNGYLFISMPGNLVTHRQCLRTRGSVQSAPLFCYRLIRSRNYVKLGKCEALAVRQLRSTRTTLRHLGHFISMTPVVGVTLSKILHAQ